MELPCDDLASNGGLNIESRCVLMSVWSFSFLGSQHIFSSKVEVGTTASYLIASRIPPGLLIGLRVVSVVLCLVFCLVVSRVV